MVPRVLRASGSTSDLAGCIAVAVSAFGWRLLEGSAASAAGASLGSAPPGSSAGDALRGSLGGSSALLSLRAAAAAPLPPAPAPLCYPFLTVGVSNLRTAARLAAREGASVVGAGAGGGGGGAPLAAGATEAVFALPGGGPALRVLHLFRRNPVVSVTLGAADAGAAAAFFEGAFGLARLRAGGAAEAQPRPERRSEVLAFGAPHNTTCLVVEEAAAAAGGGAERGALVLSVEARDVARARAAFLDKGLPTSEPGAAGSFVAMCPDGYTFHVLPAPVE
jgi:hypothetical protein